MAFEKHQGTTGKGSCKFSGPRKGGKKKKQVALHASMLHPVSKAMLGPFSQRWHSAYGLSLIACCVVLPSSPSPSPPTITCHVASYPPHLPPSPPTITCCVALPSAPPSFPSHNHLLCSVTLPTSLLPFPQSPVV